MSPLDAGGTGLGAKPRTLAQLVKAARPYLLDLIREYLPGGHLDGNEWVALNPKRVDKHEGSFRFNVDTGKWKDFSGSAPPGSAGHGIVRIVEYLLDLNSAEARQRVEADLARLLQGAAPPKGKAGGKAKPKAGPKPKRPSGKWTDGEPPLPTFLVTWEKPPLPPPVRAWFYKDKDGAIIAAVARYPKLTKTGKPVMKGGKPDKTFRPWRVEQPTPFVGAPVPVWKCGAPEGLRPLYNLHLLAKSTGPVLLVEGEKTADAAAELFKLAAVTSMGGAKAAAKADWSVLAGSEVVAWGDNGPAGGGYVATVAPLLLAAGVTVKVVTVPEDWPAKWGLAGPLPEGVTVDDLKRLLDAAEPWSRSWISMLMRDSNGSVRQNLTNAVIALTHAPELAGLLTYDQMALEMPMASGVPGSMRTDAANRLDDIHLNDIQCWLQQHGQMPTIARETVIQAVLTVARNRSFHPVRDYLDGLVWDGKKRLDTWLIDYANAEDKPYVRAISSMVMISMVARVYVPGCQCDYVLVLQGKQGEQKSKLLRVLGGIWFGDHMPALSGGDEVRASMYMRGKWIIEIADLHAFKDADIEKLKAFITRRDEDYIAKFARSKGIEPRQCICVGTTNNPEPFHDLTGNRRFWPVWVDMIDIPDFTTARDQLFAEAVVRYRAGEAWWPSPEFEKEHFEPEQEERLATDLWEDPIRKWADKQVQPKEVWTAVKGKSVKSIKPVKLDEIAFTVSEIADQVLNRDLAHQVPNDRKRIGGILRRIGWVLREVRGPAGARLFIPPGAPNPKRTRGVVTRAEREAERVVRLADVRGMAAKKPKY